MNVQQKRAWWILAVFGTTILVFLVVGFATRFHTATLGVFGLAGLAGFAPLIGRREQVAGKVTYDERDAQIDRAATVAGYSVFWLLLVVALMTPFFVLGPEARVTVPAYVLATLLVPAAAVVWGTWAVVTLLLYRRTGRG